MRIYDDGADSVEIDTGEHPVPPTLLTEEQRDEQAWIEAGRALQALSPRTFRRHIETAEDYLVELGERTDVPVH